MYMEVNDLVTYIIGTYDDKISVPATDQMKRRNSLQENITFILNVKGVHVIDIPLFEIASLNIHK